jgi:hypothetical protein
VNYDDREREREGERWKGSHRQCVSGRRKDIQNYVQEKPGEEEYGRK